MKQSKKLSDKALRLIYLRNEHFKQTQAEFAKRLGIQQGNYSNIENGNREIGPLKSKDIIMTLGLNPNWFETGIGEIFQENLTSVLAKEEDPGKLHDEAFRLYGPSPSFITVPFVSKSVWPSFIPKIDVENNTLSASMLQEATSVDSIGGDDRYNYNKLYKNIDEYYPVYVGMNGYSYKTNINIVFEVASDSMEPTINEGAKVLTQHVTTHDVEFINSGVYIVSYANELIIRRIKDNALRYEGKLTLYSDNERSGNTVLLRDDIRYVWKVLEVHQRVK